MPALGLGFGVALGGALPSPGIRLAGNSMSENSADGTQVGALSVYRGTGTYTFSLTDSAGGRFKVAGVNGVNLQASAINSDREVADRYNVTVHADNGAGSVFDATFAVFLIDVNEAAPVITSNGGGATAAINVAENTTAVTTVVATDADATAAITYSISGGADAAKFTINPATGVLSFVAAPDFEAPTDADTNNDYIVVVMASDGTNSDTQTITVTVTDVAEGGGAPISVTLTAFPTTGGASAAVQRDIALTTGSPIFAGTYSGGTPTGFQGRVRRVSDNSVVTDWTTLTSVSFGGGSFSGKLAGVPQGAGYYRDVRCLNATGVTATDTTPFMIGIGIACYGQSNMGTMFGESSGSPPSAHADTAYFNGTAWAAVPAADGVRTILNTGRTVSGVPCFAVDGSVGGTAIGPLSKGDPSGYYTAFIAKVLAMQGAEFILWRHGESGASGSGTTEAVYLPALSQLHADIAADVGRTKAQIPLILSSLATSPVAGYDNDKWDIVQGYLKKAAATLPSIYYSHSNMDATLKADQLHENGGDCAKSGARYARSITTLLGGTSGYPYFDISSSAVVNATTTTVDVAHALGTDFTPTSGITGFELSGDNGASWVSATGVRTSATRITLTHASIATDSNRKLRYQYGKDADVSGIVLDNSSLQVPLRMSGGVLSPTPLSVLPVPTWQYSGLPTTSNASLQQWPTKSIGAAAANRMLIVAMTADTTVAPTSVTATPNVGSAVVLTLADGVANGSQQARIYYGALLSDADTATSVTIDAAYGSNPFNSNILSLYTVDKTTLNSMTPVNTQKANSAAATSLSVNLTSSAGGFNIAAGFNGSISNTTHAMSGTEAYATRYSALAASAWHIHGDASGVSAHTADSAVAVTYDQSNSMALVSGSWR